MSDVLSPVPIAPPNPTSPEALLEGPASELGSSPPAEPDPEHAPPAPPSSSAPPEDADVVDEPDGAAAPAESDGASPAANLATTATASTSPIDPLLVIPPPPTTLAGKATSSGAILTGDYNYTKIYIGNLPETATLEDLQDCFGQIGPCTCQLKRGFGFAEYTDPAAAVEAVARYNEGHFLGAQIKVELAHARETPKTADPNAPSRIPPGSDRPSDSRKPMHINGPPGADKNQRGRRPGPSSVPPGRKNPRLPPLEYVRRDAPPVPVSALPPPADRYYPAPVVSAYGAPPPRDPYAERFDYRDFRGAPPPPLPLPDRYPPRDYIPPPLLPPREYDYSLRDPRAYPGAPGPGYGGGAYDMLPPARAPYDRYGLSEPLPPLRRDDYSSYDRPLPPPGGVGPYGVPPPLPAGYPGHDATRYDYGRRYDSYGPPIPALRDSQGYDPRSVASGPSRNDRGGAQRYDPYRPPSPRADGRRAPPAGYYADSRSPRAPERRRSMSPPPRSYAYAAYSPEEYNPRR